VKIYIFVDMKGISGVSGSEFVTESMELYQTGNGVTLIDGRTTEISGDSLEEIFFRI